MYKLPGIPLLLWNNIVSIYLFFSYRIKHPHNCIWVLNYIIAFIFYFAFRSLDLVMELVVYFVSSYKNYFYF